MQSPKLKIEFSRVSEVSIIFHQFIQMLAYNAPHHNSYIQFDYIRIEIIQLKNIHDKFNSPA